jgi:hypothetical protein
MYYKYHYYVLILSHNTLINSLKTENWRELLCLYIRPVPRSKQTQFPF